MNTEARLQNPLTLAFMGDAVYEVYIRRLVIEKGTIQGADRLHKSAVHYVCAAAQAKALHAMLEEGFLSAEEESLARRAHNHKTATRPKNTDPMTYKWATAFEALLGFLYLEGSTERMEEIILRAIAVIEGK